MAYRETEATRAAAQARRTGLEQAAAQIIATDGFRAATVKAVTTRAASSAGLLYRYFDNRETLLATVFSALASRELDAVRTAVDAAAPHGAPAQLVALVETFTRRALAARRTAWALLVEPVDAGIDVERLEYRRAYARLVTEVVAAGIARGELPQQDAALAGAGVVGLIGEALAGPLSPLEEDPPVQATCDGLARLVLGAVGAPQHARPGHPHPDHRPPHHRQGAS